MTQREKCEECERFAPVRKQDCRGCLGSTVSHWKGEATKWRVARDKVAAQYAAASHRAAVAEEKAKNAENKIKELKAASASREKQVRGLMTAIGMVGEGKAEVESGLYFKILNKGKIIFQGTRRSQVSRGDNE